MKKILIIGLFIFQSQYLIAQANLVDSLYIGSFGIGHVSKNIYSSNVNIVFRENYLGKYLDLGFGFNCFSLISSDPLNSQKPNLSLLQYPGALSGIFASYFENKIIQILLILPFVAPNAELHIPLYDNKKKYISIFAKSGIDYFFLNYYDYFVLYPTIGINVNWDKFSFRYGITKTKYIYHEQLNNNGYYLTISYGFSTNKSVK